MEISREILVSHLFKSMKQFLVCLKKVLMTTQDITLSKSSCEIKTESYHYYTINSHGSDINNKNQLPNTGSTLIIQTLECPNLTTVTVQNMRTQKLL